MRFGDAGHKIKAGFARDNMNREVLALRAEQHVFVEVQSLGIQNLIDDKRFHGNGHRAQILSTAFEVPLIKIGGEFLHRARYNEGTSSAPPYLSETQAAPFSRRLVRFFFATVRSRVRWSKMF